MLKQREVLELINRANQSGVYFKLTNGDLELKVLNNVDIEPSLFKELRANKNSLLLYYKNISSANLPGINLLRNENSGDVKNIPLSFSQERIWFIDKLHGSTQYHLHWEYDIKGDLNVKALENSFKKIIDRHQVLRTTIIEESGVGYQNIIPADNWKLHHTFIQQSLNQSALEDYISEKVKQPFNLSKDYCLRAELIQTDENRFVLLLIIHHIAFDAWSVSVMFDEFVHLYNEFCKGPTIVKLPALAIQYTDYAIWQRALFDKGIFGKKLAHWKSELQDVEQINFPTDFKPSQKQSMQGDSLSSCVCPDLSTALKTLSLSENVTCFITLLASFKVLLYKYTGQNDICLGTPVAGRDQPELEHLIGFFVNTLPLRDYVNGDKSFRDFLQSVRKTALNAYTNQEVPFEKIVDATIAKRDINRNPIFQILFAMQSTSRSKRTELAGVELTSKKNRVETSKFDLDISVIEVMETLNISISYRTDLFVSKTIESMLVHYVNILEEIVKDIDKPVSQIELLSKSERDVLLKEFNGSLISYSNELTIVDVFESQVSETPDALALSFGSSSLTYLQLNERANQLSRYLRNLGVKGDTLVPICIDRGIEMIVGILGILKAGGAYVPIDPDYPEERIRYILEDIGSDLVLSDCTSKIKFDVFYAGKIILLDEDWDIISTEGKSNLCISISSTNLAYVIYTSGSTGNPKGVLIEHVNVVRLFKNESSLFNFSKADVWTMFHSFCFDFSVWEMYGALFYGGRLVIVPKSTAQDSVLFSELLEREQVTVLNQTPSAFYALQDCIIDRYNSLAVKYVIFGGEALNPSKLKPWKAAYKDCQLINMYGITETTVHVTYHNLTEADINGNTSVIGKPIPTLRVYILNQDFQLSPIGVPGEIYVSGAGLARGYHKHSDLTAEKFIINPFSKEWDTRLYKTGDFGRWLSDGTIEFLGRSDNQVKINGYRIELGEIEHALTKLEGIKECVVLMEEINDEYKKLTAYYTSIFPIPNIALKEHLARRLPTYCLPSYFVRVASMPLTSNGKVDKKLLRSMPNLSLKKIRNRKPHTSIEIKIASIWQDVLNVDVHTNDTFFNLGGNSISVIKAMHLIHAQIGVKLTIKDFFDCNLQQLAKKCEKHSNI